MSSSAYPSHPGDGHLHLSSPPPNSQTHPSFSILTSTYPLKLLPPSPLPSQPFNLAICYILAYGGGLVAGDEVSLRVSIGKGAGLALLTQGSTKVFKSRGGGLGRPKSSWHSNIIPNHSTLESTRTKQRLHITLESGSFLLLLPDLVQPFSGSEYEQKQRVVIPTGKRNRTRYQAGARELEEVADGKGTNGIDVGEKREEKYEHQEGEPASLLILDWFTSGGRHNKPTTKHKGSEPTSEHIPNPMSTNIKPDTTPSTTDPWTFSYYSSLNEVIDTNGKIIMRDHLILEPPHPITGPSTTLAPSAPQIPSLPTLASRMSPHYTTYSTLLIHGPTLFPLLDFLEALGNSKSSAVFQRRGEKGEVEGLIWSFSGVDWGKVDDVGGGGGGRGAKNQSRRRFKGGILRVAGKETEQVKAFLKTVLENGRVKELMGEGIWERVFPG